MKLRSLRRAARVGVAVVGAAAVVGACASATRSRLETEAFGSTTTHSRSFALAPGSTCEAARRALLSQGFVITSAEVEHVRGRKNFQPEAETHIELEFNVVCVHDGRGGTKSIAFVNALQDRYALKKSSTSASVGVGPIGSLSLPFSSSDDALVKVASETITSAPFYDRFFSLLQRYLVVDSEPVAPKIPPAMQPNAPVLQPEPSVRSASAP